MMRLLATMSTLGLLAMVLAAAPQLVGLAASPASAQPIAVAPDAQPPRLDAAYRTAIIDSVTAALDTAYVFPDVARKMNAHVRGRLAAGQYEAHTDLTSFAQALTEDLRSISHDLHLGVMWLPPEPTEAGDPLTDRQRRLLERAEAARRNFGFASVEVLAGNVGYLDLRNFMAAAEAGPTAVAAMNFLGNCDALIIDLRRNGGGTPQMIQLLTSYLLDEPTHLNSFYIRKDDSTKQFWSHAWVPGPRLAKTPVWVLTSNRTFSGAEEFAYNLKNLKRGTLVGETTGGGAHPVEMHAFPSLQVGVRVPFGRAINPVSRTNWEGIGVEPDMKTPAEQALAVAHTAALRQLLEKARAEELPVDFDVPAAMASELARQWAGELEWALQGLEAEVSPWTPDARALRAYAGAYGPRRITLEDGSLHYQREGRPKMRLLPLAPDLFAVEGLDYFRVRFARDSGERVEKLIGLYDDGRQDENARTGR